MDMLQEEFVALVNQKLTEKGWTRAALAEAMDVPPQFVTNYLNGRRSPGSDVIARFFAALGYEVHFQLKEIASEVRRRKPIPA